MIKGGSLFDIYLSTTLLNSTINIVHHKKERDFYPRDLSMHILSFDYHMHF